MGKRILVAIVAIVVFFAILYSCSNSLSSSEANQSSGSTSSTKKPIVTEPPELTIPEIKPLDPDLWGSLDVDAINNQYYVSWTAKLIYNNSVGSDWRTFVTVAGNDVGEAPVAVTGNVLTVDVKAVECDSLNDVGTGTINFLCSDIGSSQTKTVRVCVRENRGRYAGNEAVWEFTITATKAN